MGHAQRMLPIVAAYLAQGWKITVAARHVTRVNEALRGIPHLEDHHLSIIQAPIFLHRAPVSQTPPVSLAEIFVNAGFVDVRLCRPVIRAWHRLLDEIAPDVVLSDFAPSLNVVASGMCPLLVIGNGWTIPPAHELPTFAGLRGDPVSRESGERIVDTLRAASGGRLQASSFCDLLRGDANFVCTLPQLDPYHRYRAKEYYWPVEIPPPSTEQTNVKDVVAVYLPSDHPALPLVGTLARNLPWRFSVYAGPMSRPPERNMLFSSKPLNLCALLPLTRLAIHHGGLGMANWCLVHCVPQIILPTDTEKLLTGREVMRTGSGFVAEPSVRLKNIVEQAKRLSDLSLSRPDIDSMQTASDIDTLAALISASEGREHQAG